VSYVAAVLPNDAEEYSTYTTRQQTGAAGSAADPSSDSVGTLTNLASGTYQYVFKTRAPSGFDATATHTIGIYGSRNLTTFGLGTNYASTNYNFVPNGTKASKTMT
jgi:hypothetical protein